MIRILFILFVFCMISVDGGVKTSVVPRVVKSKRPPEVANPLDLERVALTATKAIGITNVLITDVQAVCWSLKISEANVPPVLVEEICFIAKISNSKTNNWLIACLERVAGRGQRNAERWHTAHSGDDFDWYQLKQERTTLKDLEKFLKNSNFGNNECNSSIKPVYILLYEPFGGLARSISRGIASSEKERRFSQSHRILWE